MLYYISESAIHFGVADRLKRVGIKIGLDSWIVLSSTILLLRLIFITWLARSSSALVCYHFKKGVHMDDELKRLREKVDTLEMWIVFLVILVLISIGWNFFNYRIIQECNEYVSEIRDNFNSFNQILNSLMGN